MKHLSQLRERWWSLGNTLQGEEFASERGWLSKEAREALPQLRSDYQAAIEAYAAALALARRDAAAFAAWVDSLVGADDSPTLRRRKRDMRDGVWWDWGCRTYPDWAPRYTIRDAAPEDPIADLVTAAFDGPAEAAIVSRLQDQPGVTSLVALDGEDVVGHVMTSPVTIDGEDRNAVGLAPVSVRPNAQGRGVGSALVQAALTAARDAENTLCFVLGDPAYYARLGFVTAAPRWRCKWPGTEAAFQVTFHHWGLQDAYPGGLVEYHPAFDSE